MAAKEEIMAADPNQPMESAESAPPVSTAAAATAETGKSAETAETAATAGTAQGIEANIEDSIVEALKTVYDPEIPVNIYEMGLIYDLNIEPGGQVQIKMTLTSPACPVAGSLPGEVKDKVESVPGVAAAEVEVVWDPVWNPSMMSEAARLQLGMF
jgi:FeS assembly SUF system protein